MKNLWTMIVDNMEKDAKSACKVGSPELYDCGDGVYLRIFDGVGSAEFEQLKAEFRDKFETIEETGICENRFVFAKVGDGYFYAIYIPSHGEVRLLYTEHGDRIPSQLGEKDAYVGEQKITQITPDPANFGMCYIIELGEGHFLLYDGLWKVGEDEKKIYGVLKAGTPEGQKPVIDAWILTHPHADHIGGVAKFALTYSADVEVRNFVLNLPNPHAFPIRLWKEICDCYSDWMPSIRKSFPSAVFHRVHTGDRFRVGQAEVEVLFTQEEAYPNELIVNDTSLVSRVFLNGKKLFFPADVQSDEPCLLIHDMYGAYLKSDYYQIAHHAWDTEALRFYGDVDPQTLFWPLRRKDWIPTNRMWTFPATIVMKKEMDENRRRFLVAMDENISEML